MSDPLNSERRSKIFNACFLFTVLGVVVAMLALNVAVDPWRLLARSDAESNRGNLLTANNANDRILKPYRIRQADFDVLFVGSSRVRGLLTGRGGMQDRKLTSPFFGQSKVFVAAYSGVNMYVIRRTVEHALALKDLEEVYLLIDFVAMNDNRPNGEGWKDDRYKGGRFEETWFGRIANFMSVNMLKDTLSSLRGRWGARATEEITSPKTSSGYDPVARRAWITQKWSSNIAEFFRSDLYGCHTIGGTTVGHLETLLKKLSENGVRATLMTPVLHPAMMEMIWRTGNWRNYEAFLGLLAQMGDRYAAPVWTFSPYADVFSGDLFDLVHSIDPGFHDKPGFYDPAHVNSVIGREILSYVRGLKPNGPGTGADFAFRLRPDNLAPVLAGFRDSHRQYRQNHPDVMSLIPVVRAGENGRCGKDYGYPPFAG